MSDSVCLYMFVCIYIYTLCVYLYVLMCSYTSEHVLLNVYLGMYDYMMTSFYSRMNLCKSVNCVCMHVSYIYIYIYIYLIIIPRIGYKTIA